MALYNDLTANKLGNTQIVLRDDQAITPEQYETASSIATLDAHLLDNGHTDYTQAQLDKMTKQDKIYAYRLTQGAALTPDVWYAVEPPPED